MMLKRNANQTFILFDWAVLTNAVERLPGLLNETREYCLPGYEHPRGEIIVTKKMVKR